MKLRQALTSRVVNWPVVIPHRNVPGVSLYFLSLSRLRALVGRSSLFRAKPSPSTASTASTGGGGGKVKLTPIGDLLVGSTARTAVGFALTPFTLLKTLSEVGPLPFGRFYKPTY